MDNTVVHVPSGTRRGGKGHVLHPKAEHEPGKARTSTCIWCLSKISKAGGSVTVDSVLEPKAAAAMRLRCNGRMLDTACANKLAFFMKRCDSGLHAHKTLAALRPDHVKKASKIKVKNDNGSGRVRKRNCNPHWEGGRPWKYMNQKVVGMPPLEEIHYVKKMIKSLPSDRMPPFPQPAALTARDATLLGSIFEKTHHPSTSAYMLWSYLTDGVRSDAEEGKEIEHKASYAAFFLLDECVRTWPLGWTQVVQHMFVHRWTSSWGPVAVINNVYSGKDDEWLIDLSRKSPPPLKNTMHNAEVNNARLARGQAIQSRQVTCDCIILCESKLGASILKGIRLYPACSRCPHIPMAISFALNALRKNNTAVHKGISWRAFLRTNEG